MRRINAREGFFSFNREAGVLSFLLFSNNLEFISEVELRDYAGRSLGAFTAVTTSARVPTLTISGLHDLTPGCVSGTRAYAGRVLRLVWLAWG
jgi:hypothetical protein